MQVFFKCNLGWVVRTTRGSTRLQHTDPKRSKDKVPASRNPIIEMRVNVRCKGSACRWRVIRYLRLNLCNPLLMPFCFSKSSLALSIKQGQMSVAICGNANLDADFTIGMAVLIIVILAQTGWGDWAESAQKHNTVRKGGSTFRCWAVPLFEHYGHDINLWGVG